jgi:lysophospholipid acyltransferase (LPLAT)-like uncharacterized protein
VKLSRDSRLYRLQLVVVGWLGATFLRVLGSTWRFESHGPDPIGTTPLLIGAAWHRGLLVAAWRWRDHGLAIPVSQSRDGDLVEGVLRRLGFAESPRGSSSRGGSALLRALIRCLRDGGTVGILPDGPRGPAGEAKPGVVALARATGAAVIPVGVAASPVLRFRSWDRAILPLPFARVRCHYGSPLRVPKEASGQGLEEWRRRLEQALDAIDEEAEEGLSAPGRSA